MANIYKQQNKIIGFLLLCNSLYVPELYTAFANEYDKYLLFIKVQNWYNNSLTLKKQKQNKAKIKYSKVMWCKWQWTADRDSTLESYMKEELAGKKIENIVSLQ